MLRNCFLVCKCFIYSWLTDTEKAREQVELTAGSEKCCSNLLNVTPLKFFFTIKESSIRPLNHGFIIQEFVQITALN